MTLILQRTETGFAELPRNKNFVDGDGNQTAYESLLLWSPQMLSARGLYKRESLPVPDGKLADGYTWTADASDLPVQTWTNLRDYVPPTIEEIRDELIQAIDDARSIDRAIVLELLAESTAAAGYALAIHRAIKASTTYANLKTGVTVVAEYTPKTSVQVRAGIRGRIT